MPTMMDAVVLAAVLVGRNITLNPLWLHCLSQQPLRPFANRPVLDRQALTRPPNGVATLGPHVDTGGNSSGVASQAGCMTKEKMHPALRCVCASFWNGVEVGAVPINAGGIEIKHVNPTCLARSKSDKRPAFRVCATPRRLKTARNHRLL